LSKQKIPKLADFVKVWYKNLSAKQPDIGYFLLNTYQRPEALANLGDGSVRGLRLISGKKHAFFSRISQGLFLGANYSTEKARLTNFNAARSP
jgi:hypothetical protein